MKTWQGSMVVGIIAAMTLFGSLWAWANPYNSYVDQRQRDQEQRIQQAWHSGQLTPQEYHRLEKRLQHIRQLEGRMRADGRLDPAEKTRINEMLNQSEMDIYRSTHHYRRPGWH
jgi:uncharacterized membrane protein YebE (DUF533 family)